jgi:CRISPR/Cas system CMR-associated protein Cmr3 (group 5 of RAMP superfamily)
MEEKSIWTMRSSRPLHQTRFCQLFHCFTVLQCTIVLQNKSFSPGLVDRAPGSIRMLSLFVAQGDGNYCLIIGSTTTSAISMRRL